MSRPPVLANELREGEERLDDARRESAELAPALDVDLEGRGIAARLVNVRASCRPPSRQRTT
jgi:hypothetical protein